MQANSTTDRLAVLDGWRGLSMLGVLACHLLPVGPKAWGMNEVVGMSVMTILFSLSGFLITANLLRNDDVRVFYVRRVCRILPLAYPFLAVVLLLYGKDLETFAAYFLFQINYRPEFIFELTSPLWSLCVEMHFYLFIGLLVAVFGRKGLYALPLIGVLLTVLRIAGGNRVSLQTHLRADEILAGAAAALVHFSPACARLRRLVATPHPLIWIVLLMLCCHDSTNNNLAYLRPYPAACLIACTLWREGAPSPILLSRVLRYVGDISYSLYVLHPILRVGWLGSGSKLELYLFKRPLGFLMLFAVAHLSTFYYEHKWIAWSKKWFRRPRTAPVAAPVVGTTTN